MNSKRGERTKQSERVGFNMGAFSSPFYPQTKLTKNKLKKVKIQFKSQSQIKINQYQI